ncbi:MAG: 30S ribosome-binding factor RbfA [Candidatus Eisenbacteria bacterium]|uniref:Ribosome-binding factor A n=1 Tax=Eiseniibacteriota bacterium TaxID=2212470 RepID=A0A538T8L6_UNCEI|nr:MAG: 30S ribosome-binding factor RbfA [Candidatus Eisenbacteria bacterium]
MPSRKQSPRTRRVADRIQVELAEILSTRTEDPRLRVLSVTGAEVSRDFSLAKVWVAGTLLTPDSEPNVLQALARATPYFRSLLAARLGLRIVPELQFQIDRSIEKGARIEQLLREIQEPPDE